MKKIILAGGGHGHVTLLRELKNKPLPNTEIHLISDYPLQYYSGMLPGYIQGVYSKEDFSFNLQELANQTGVSFHCETIKQVDANRQTVTTDSSTYPYDLLSLNLGVISDDLLPIKSGSKVCKTKPINEIVEFCDNLTASPFMLSIVGGGLSGCELAIALALAFPNSRIRLINRHHRLALGFPERVGQLIIKRLKAINVEVVLNCQVYEVKEKHLETSQGNLNFDYAILANGYRGPDIRFQGLDLNANGLIKTNHHLHAAPNVFAMGDLIKITGQEWIPRAGVFAIHQAPVLVKNLRAAVNGQDPPVTYKAQPQPLQIINTGNKKAIFIQRKLAFENHLAYILKDAIDRRYMGTFPWFKQN